MQCGKFTFNLKQHPCQCIGIPYHSLKLIFVHFRNLVKVRKLSLSFKYPGMVIQHDIRAFLIIIFIMYLTNNFFNDILHCHQSGSTSELIHNDSNMNLVRLKITKQIINHLCLRHKISRPDQ